MLLCTHQKGTQACFNWGSIKYWYISSNLVPHKLGKGACEAERFRDFQGFLIVATLWGMVAATGRAFYEISSPAGLLMAAYQIWVTFALAGSIIGYWKNRDLDKKLE